MARTLCLLPVRFVIKAGINPFIFLSHHHGRVAEYCIIFCN